MPWWPPLLDLFKRLRLLDDPRFKKYEHAPLEQQQERKPEVSTAAISARSVTASLGGEIRNRQVREERDEIERRIRTSLLVVPRDRLDWKTRIDDLREAMKDDRKRELTAGNHNKANLYSRCLQRSAAAWEDIGFRIR